MQEKISDGRNIGSVLSSFFELFEWSRIYLPNCLAHSKEAGFPACNQVWKKARDSSIMPTQCHHLLAFCHNRNCKVENHLVTPVVPIFLLEGCSFPISNLRKSITTLTLAFFWRRREWWGGNRTMFLRIISIFFPDNSWDHGEEKRIPLYIHFIDK